MKAKTHGWKGWSFFSVWGEIIKAVFWAYVPVLLLLFLFSPDSVCHHGRVSALYLILIIGLWFSPRCNLLYQTVQFFLARVIMLVGSWLLFSANVGFGSWYSPFCNLTSSSFWHFPHKVIMELSQGNVGCYFFFPQLVHMLPGATITSVLASGNFKAVYLQDHQAAACRPLKSLEINCDLHCSCRREEGG